MVVTIKRSFAVHRGGKRKKRITTRKNTIITISRKVSQQNKKTRGRKRKEKEGKEKERKEKLGTVENREYRMASMHQ